ncbi:MAG: choice-of-anchor B family protein [Sphingobacteriales bacterium]|nr:choice-of-anchor B family protein [Sphingobacteriales bacterium]
MRKLHFFWSIWLCCWATTTAQNQMQLLSNYTYSEMLSSCWGYAANDKEYALVGLKNGLSVVDVTTPEQPEQVQFIPAQANSIWREMKTFSHYAYIVHDGFSGNSDGLLIADLQYLPDSIHYQSYYGINDTIATVHTLWVDEDGYLYLYGYNNKNKTVPVGQRGALILDLNANPMQPPIVGAYSNYYAHDGYVRNKRLYSGEIYNGHFSVVDVSDKSAPQILTTQETPGAFTHNTWLSDDSHTLYTTDEKGDAYIAAYNIEDLNDVQLLDIYQSNAGSNAAPHNVKVFNDFIVASYYNDGVVIVDAHEPDNLVQTEFYDTNPLGGCCFEGCWDAYPFLPSGNIIASDRATGLWVVQPTYQRAAYIKGMVSDSASGALLHNVQVKILNTAYTDSTNIAGAYKSGVANAGVYTVEFSKFGYYPKTVTTTLNTAEYTNLDVQLVQKEKFTLTIETQVSAVCVPYTAACYVLLINPEGEEELYISDQNGIIQIPDFVPDQYDIYIGLWGQQVSYYENYSIDENFIILYTGGNNSIADDFFFDYGWQVSGDSINGMWERGIPHGATHNNIACAPYSDVNDDYGGFCYMTGNAAAALEQQDLDAGTTILRSPDFSWINPEGFDNLLSFNLWVCGSGSSVIRCSVGNDDTTFLLQEWADMDITNSTWQYFEFSRPDNSKPFATYYFEISVTETDTSATAYTEVAFDNFRVEAAGVGFGNEPQTILPLAIAPNPTADMLQVRFSAKQCTKISACVSAMHRAGAYGSAILCLPPH